jgi:hypothetical protein
MDNLEEHIRRNREDFDKYAPSVKIWKGIRRNLKMEKLKSRQWIYIAAMLAVILGTAVIFFRPVYRWSDSHSAKNSDELLTRGSTPLNETETYYKTLVNSLYKEAAPLLINNPDIKRELNTDLSHIDSICTEVKKDLKDNISNQEVVAALIQNYRIKIKILEDMLTVLKANEINPEKKKSHEI